MIVIQGLRNDKHASNENPSNWISSLMFASGYDDIGNGVSEQTKKNYFKLSTDVIMMATTQQQQQKYDCIT